MGELHVFANKVTDWVVATSPEDASAVWVEHCGLDGETYPEREHGAWSQLPDDKALVIRDEDHDQKITKTAAEWAAHNGRGFLASTEY